MRSRVQLAGYLVDEQRNGHSPGALARDAPIRAHGDHAGDALLAPGGHPIDVLNGLERALAQSRLIHADEPLRGGAKYHRRLVAPAMRIGMMIRLVLQQPAVLDQHLDDMCVGVEYLLAGKQRRAGQKAPVAADRIVDFQVVAPADDVVIEAMAGRGVHRSGAGIERHVIAENHRHLPIVKRMLQQQDARVPRLWPSRARSNRATPACA